MRWRLYIEEYSPDLQYIKGENNVVADALSQLNMELDPNTTEALMTEGMCSNWYCYAKEEQNYNSHPLSYQQLEKAQHTDKQMMESLKLDKSLYKNHYLHGGGNY